MVSKTAREGITQRRKILVAELGTFKSLLFHETVDRSGDLVRRDATAPTPPRPTSLTCWITCSTNMITASGPTLEVQFVNALKSFALECEWKVNSYPKFQKKSTTQLTIHILLTNLILPHSQGPALKVLVNMQVRSMGPISETDMVSGLGSKWKANSKSVKIERFPRRLPCQTNDFLSPRGKPEWLEGTDNFLSSRSKAFCDLKIESWPRPTEKSIIVYIQQCIFGVFNVMAITWPETKICLSFVFFRLCLCTFCNANHTQTTLKKHQVL